MNKSKFTTALSLLLLAALPAAAQPTGPADTATTAAAAAAILKQYASVGKADTATTAAASAATNLKDMGLQGIPNNQEALNQRGLYPAGNITGVALFYAITDITAVHGGLKNLLSQHLDNRHPQSAQMQALQNLREQCLDTPETFAQKDCLIQLNKAFADMGKQVMQSQQLMLWGTGIIGWDDERRRLSLQNIHLGGSGCDADTACMRIGPYNNFNWNLLCFQLDKPLPVDLSYTLSDSEARALSQRSGDLRNLTTASFVLKVTQQPQIISPRMCTSKYTHDKVVAQGKATIAAEVLWNRSASQFVHYTAVTGGQRTSSVNKPTAVPLLSDTARQPEVKKATGKVVIDAK